MKTIEFRGMRVARGSELYQLLEDGKKAVASARATDLLADFHKHVPEMFCENINERIKQQNAGR